MAGGKFGRGGVSGIALSWLCLSALAALVCSAGVGQGALLTSEEELRAYPSWAVIDEWTAPGHFASRQDVLDHLSVFAPYGCNADFARYSKKTTILVADYLDAEWATRRPIGDGSHSRRDGQYYFTPLRYVFEPDVRLHVFLWHGTFINRVCGNFTPRLENPTGTLEVRKFDDSNMNGLWDGDEDEIRGWKVSYVGPQDGSGVTPVRVTVRPGSYSVSEKDRPGWRHTTPTTVSVRVNPGKTTTVAFGNVQLGSISGVKWDDTDCDQQKGGAEAPLAGWNITLSGRDAGGAPVHLTTVTGPEGRYRFENLPPSDGAGYTVSETLAAADQWGPTAPLDPIPNPLPLLVEPQSHCVALSEGDDVAGIDFGNVRLGEIIGFKFYDATADLPPDAPSNGNGCFDAGEPLLSGWEFTLNGDCDLQVSVSERQASTDGEGVFRFDRLYPSHVGEGYTICEVKPEGWILTTPQELCRGVHLDEGQSVEVGLAFGNLRIVQLGARTMGYWKTHPDAVTEDMYQALALLPAFQGVDTERELTAIFRHANARKMDNMLRAQLLALTLNVLADIVPPDTWTYVGNIPGASDLFGGNIVTIQEVLDVIEAAYPWTDWSRDQQEAAKDVCDNANNNDNLVSPAP